MQEAQTAPEPQEAVMPPPPPVKVKVTLTSGVVDGELVQTNPKRSVVKIKKGEGFKSIKVRNSLIKETGE